MSNLLQFTAGGIKSIQRGEIEITAGSSTATVTISAVNLAKTEFRYGGSSGEAARARLLSSASVLAARANTSGSSIVPWEVTEYY